MITLKLASKLLLVAAPVSGGVGGTVYLMTNSDNKSTTATNTTTEPQKPTVRRRKSTIRNYLIQSVSEIEAVSKLTCELTTTCKLFSRDTTSDKNETNLKLLTSFTDFTNNAHYVLSINGKDLKEGDLVSITFSDQTNKFKVISSMSYKTDKLKIPKPPSTLLTKDKWINLNGFKSTNSDAFDHLKNRFFINQTYPTHIEWEDINHKKYVVLKWKEVIKDKKLHQNKKYLFYFPKGAESAPNKDWQQGLLNNGKKPSFALFQHPFDAGVVDGINDLDTKINVVDHFLFKPFNIQKDEAEEVGRLEAQILQHTGETLKNMDLFNTIVFEHKSHTPLEIYEIADQANIGKAFPQSPNTEGNASLVDWEQIDKDGKMITKASEMKDGHYYKFVFEDESFMDKAFQRFWIKLEVILHNKKNTTTNIATYHILAFDTKSEDFYCYRTPKENKCLYFKQLDEQIPNPRSSRHPSSG